MTGALSANSGHRMGMSLGSMSGYMNKIALFLFAAIALPAFAGDFGDEGLPQLTTAGSLDIWVGAPIQALSITCPEQEPGQGCDDDYVLTVKTGGKEVAYPFTASYGRFHLYLASLSKYPDGDLILLRSEGRGTSASSWYLDILDVDSGKLVLKYETLIGAFFGSGETWWYTVHFKNYEPKDNGDEYQSIRLKLFHDDITHDPLEDISLIPKDDKITIYWDLNQKKYIQKTGWIEQ